MQYTPNYSQAPKAYNKPTTARGISPKAYNIADNLHKLKQPKVP